MFLDVYDLVSDSYKIFVLPNSYHTLYLCMCCTNAMLVRFGQINRTEQVNEYFPPISHIRSLQTA